MARFSTIFVSSTLTEILDYIVLQSSFSSVSAFLCFSSAPSCLQVIVFTNIHELVVYVFLAPSCLQAIVFTSIDELVVYVFHFYVFLLTLSLSLSLSLPRHVCTAVCVYAWVFILFVFNFLTFLPAQENLDSQIA